MRPSQGKTPSSSTKSDHRRDQALHAGVGAFHVIPTEHFDDHSSHNDRQTAESEAAQFESVDDVQREARRNDIPHLDDEEERNTAVELECGCEYGDMAVADAVHDNDVFIPSATQYDPDSKSSPISKHRPFRRYGFAGIYVLLVVIVVSISIAVIRNNSKSDNQIAADASGSQTIFPTPGPTTSREFEGIFGELIKISSIEKLNDPNSAQFKAAQWIQFEDPQQLGVDADNLLQRYALVVMYFSLQENGPWFFCGADESSHKDPDLCTGQMVVDLVDPQDPSDNIYEKLENETKWLSAKSECVWLGVFCNKDNVTVNAIEIAENNLVGTLPEELASLTFLTDLIIEMNGLKGTLPHWLSSYRQLIGFSFYYNQFTGEIPHGVYELEGLEYLSVEGNMLTGTVSTQIGKLENLKVLDIVDNMMTGTIPTEIGIWTDWGANPFDTTLPTEIGRLGSIQFFWMNSMGLKGTIPTEIGLMTDLEYVSVYLNSLEGSIPEEMFNARNMSHVRAEFNKLNGTIPTQLGQLTKLREADCLKPNVTFPPKNDCQCCDLCCDSAPGGLCLEPE
eukprot:scaffold82038_cov74-Attheya_sp.AAC.2